MKPKVEHTVFRNEKLFCLNCGEYYIINFPIGIPEMNNKVKAFNELHRDCKKTWIEPVADQTLTIEQRAAWWLKYAETGLSSKTIYGCLLNKKGFVIYHPCDPDDFKRCYNLLEAIPEWKKELHKLKPLSKEWSNLVDNWDTLTKMYEKNVSEWWEDDKEIGMFEFMQKLINNK